MATSATDLLVWGSIAHLGADWLLQNHWQATNKADVRHPAGWVHAAFHAMALSLVFPWPAALALGAVHLLIDTRLPLAFWRRLIGQTEEGPMAVHVAIWSDQVLHLFCVAAAARLVGS